LVIHNRQRSFHWWQVIVAGDKAQDEGKDIADATKLWKDRQTEREGVEEKEGEREMVKRRRAIRLSEARLGVLRSSRDRKKSRSWRNDGRGAAAVRCATVVDAW